MPHAYFSKATRALVKNRTISFKLDSDHRYAQSKLPVTDDILRLRLTSVQTKDHIRVTRRSTQSVYKVLGLIAQSEYYARDQAVTHRNT